MRAHFIRSAADPPRAFAAIEQARSQALVVKNNSLTYDLRAAFIESSQRLRIPDMYEERALVATGGFVSYGPDGTELYRQAAGYVERIFKGAKPADLPVQQPTKFALVLNLKTAKAIGLTSAIRYTTAKSWSPPADASACTASASTSLTCWPVSVSASRRSTTASGS